MASPASSRTVRNVAGRVRHVLLPSRRALAVELAIEVAALLGAAPLVAHVAIALCVHVVIGLAERKRR